MSHETRANGMTRAQSPIAETKKSAKARDRSHTVVDVSGAALLGASVNRTNALPMIPMEPFTTLNHARMSSENWYSQKSVRWNSVLFDIMIQTFDSFSRQNLTPCSLNNQPLGCT